MSYSEVKKGVVKRKVNRAIGIFIDGTGLDRATRRIHRKVELSALVKSLSTGITPVVARYYTIIPNEDDSRHHAYLDALSKAGLEVIVKRLPPKGVDVKVDIYPEMSSDMIAFALGHRNFSSLGTLQAQNEQFRNNGTPEQEEEPKEATANEIPENEKKSIIIVCPARELSYPISLAKELGVDTTSADFGEYAGRDVLKNAAKWIDLSDSESIWRHK